MATQWKEISEKKAELYQDIPQSIIDSYEGKSGIYGIYIQDVLVYVGQSKNLLNRWVAHKINTLYDFKQKDYKEEKYEVLREAYKRGYVISCKLLEECEICELNKKESQWINDLSPILNGGFASMVALKGFNFLEKLQKSLDTAC